MRHVVLTADRSGRNDRRDVVRHPRERCGAALGRVGGAAGAALLLLGPFYMPQLLVPLSALVVGITLARRPAATPEAVA